MTNLSSPDKRIRGRKGAALRKRRLANEPLCRDCFNAEPQRIRAAQVVDHVLPLALGGDDVDANCRSLCHDCHYTRTREQFGQRKRQAFDVEGWPI